MELTRISLDDVYPDEANPRSKESMGDIGALADSFGLNAVNPGEPVNPIVVVRDGGIYRIVDGERRYRAMKSLRKADCAAVVCDGLDEANAMLAMLATDDKERLTDEERSRGVQQMLLLGVDPEKVERAGRMGRGSARRVRRAMSKVEDAAEDMTLDRLLAIEELADDADAVERLSNCSEGEWRRVYAAVVHEREVDAAADALEEAAREAGIEVVDEMPDGMAYQCHATDPKDVPALAAIEGCAAVVLRNWRAEIRFYAPDEDEGAEAKAEMRRRADELESAVRAGAERRKKWFAGRVGRGTYDAGAVADALKSAVEKTRENEYQMRTAADYVEAFEEDTGSSARFSWTPWLAEYAYERHSRGLGESPTVLRDGTVREDDAGRWLDWLGMCVHDGYAPDDADELAKKACVAAFEKSDE